MILFGDESWGWELPTIKLVLSLKKIEAGDILWASVSVCPMWWLLGIWKTSNFDAYFSITKVTVSAAMAWLWRGRTDRIQGGIWPATHEMSLWAHYLIRSRRPCNFDVRGWQFSILSIHERWKFLQRFRPEIWYGISLQSKVRADYRHWQQFLTFYKA
jgi:hypothetical protein